MDTYTHMVQQVEAVRSTFTPEVYEVATNTLDALKLLCEKRDAANGKQFFMYEPIETLVLYLLALIKNPNKAPSVTIH